ncbi:MAG: O-antigen ligase family protein [Candidatus Zixiibacteriota bacterium]
MNRTAQPASSSQIWSFFITVVIAGALAGVFILAASGGGVMPLALLLFGVASLCVVLVLNYAVGEFELFVLAGTFFAFCFIGIDVNLFYQRSDYYNQQLVHGTLTGVRITLPDAVFFYLLVSWLKKIAFGEEQLNLLEKPNLLFVLYFAFVVASNFVAIYPLRGFFQTLMVAKVFLYYIYFSKAIKSGSQLKGLLWIFLLLLCFQDGLGFLQKATGSTLGLDILGGETKETAVGLKYVSRVTGTTPHPNSLGRFIGFLWPIFLALMFVERIKRRHLWLLSGVLLFSLATLYFTLSRSGWLGALTSVPMIMFLSLRRRGVAARRILLYFAVTGLTVFCLLLLVSSDFRARLYLEESKYRFPGFSPLEAAYRDFLANPRIPMSWVALNMIAANPILGVGLGHFKVEMRRYDDTPEAAGWSGLALVHNMPLLTACESGIGAAVFLYAFLFAVFWRGYKSAKGKNHFLAAIIWGLLAGEITWFVTTLFNIYEIGYGPMSWAMLGLIIALGKMPDEEAHKTGFLEKSSA